LGKQNQIEDDMESLGLLQNRGLCEDNLRELQGLQEKGQGLVWEQFLSRLEQNGQTSGFAATVADFVEHKFVPEHVAEKGLSGRTHYQALMKHVLTPDEADRVFHIDAHKSKTRLKGVRDWPYLGHVRLSDVKPDDVQRLISAAIAHGYSTQTVKHIRSVVSAIFAHAKKTHWFTGDNPAGGTTVPEMTRKEAHSLTLPQANEVLGLLQYPEREMTLIAILTGMNATEICGLQWQRVNTGESWAFADGEPLPPRTIAVRKQWHRLGLDDLGRKSRNRSLPIPAPLLPILIDLRRRAEHGGPEDFVLVTPAGTPFDEHTIARRVKAIGKTLRMPWLSWHVFRRTHTTLAYDLGLQLLQRTVGAGPVTVGRRSFRRHGGVSDEFPAALRFLRSQAHDTPSSPMADRPVSEART
jgi:integrase